MPVAVVTAALFAAGCGSVGFTEGTGDRAKGKELFIQKCGSCHTLADAGTKGQIGPNLDYAFLESRRSGLGESTFVQVVRGQIAYPIAKPSTGAPGMPANLVEGQDADDIASYVGERRRGRQPERRSAHSPPRRRPRRPAPGGGGTAGDAAAGKEVFTSAGCVSCHTLADAGSSGTVGPNLDDAKPDAALVTRARDERQGRRCRRSRASSTRRQIADVAAYVSSVAGK